MNFNLGGMMQGFSAKQTNNSSRNSSDTMTRSVLRRSWNNTNVSRTLNGQTRVIGPFRAVNNLGDYLGRENYSCGGPNQVGIWNRGGSVPQQCDGTGIAAASCNPKFVPDSSDYIKFKKQRAVSNNYNDSSFGGDESNGSYTALMRVRR